MTTTEIEQTLINVDLDEERDELPEGWVLTTIGEVCELNPPKPPKDYRPADALVSFVPMPAVDAASGTISAPLKRPYGKVRSGFTAFREGDVIVAKITPCMENGKAAIARNLTNSLGFGSTEFHVLRSGGALLPEYLFYFVRQETFREAAEANMAGSVGQQRVPPQFISKAPIPVPPIAEQRRIVSQIETLLGRATEVRSALMRASSVMKRFRQSVLAAACSGGSRRTGGTASSIAIHPDPLVSSLICWPTCAARDGKQIISNVATAANASTNSP